MNRWKWLPPLLAGAGLFASAQAADMNKTLRVTFVAPESGFDPAKVYDVYSLGVIDNIFDTLYRYDYLARPLVVTPATAQGLPQVSADGKVFTIKIRPGIYFADDPVFKGKKRELTAMDYAYSFKRFADPVVNSPSPAGFTDFIIGLEEAGKQARKTGKFNYDGPMEGIQVLDRYTLQLRLKKPNFNFINTLAAQNAGAVAREAIEAYAKDTNSHPVGTGPYMLKDWKPGNRIMLEANPGYRKDVFSSVAAADPANAEIMRDLQGKTLPIVGRIDIKVLEEEQPRWLSFLNKQLDVSGVPKSAIPSTVHSSEANPFQASLNPMLAQRGIRLHHNLGMDVTYAFFNMRDPVVGGYSKQKVALRRAIGMAYPSQEVIKLLYSGQAIQLQNLVPLNMVGNDPHFRGAPDFNPALANALLDQAGYKIGPDGYRRQPNGQPLLITQATQGSAFDKQFNQIWQKTFDSIRLRVVFKVAKWNENLKASYAGKLQMWTLGGSAATPDGDDFVSSLWSGLIGQGSKTFFSHPDYDRAYLASQILPNGPERDKQFDRMNRVAAAYQPMIPGVTRFNNIVSHGYVKGVKVHPMSVDGVAGSWRYVDIDLSQRP
ncbi:MULTISPECIES: ABC transporter substrate-binding protein [Chromobacterium]|uniref:ABC transporter substrate-binding protein n=1 Tax=Chromobacterium TaxID=535 RepID=UPI001887D409|nr:MULTISPECIES: ABC transporter substrate-binding protein [Chromobacterium]QOZ84727.1 ABC transporter substrate-binding protein [Chromobacterium sp. Rain0013]WON84913.1 ABC transporter substrate-binding protein [Chromobacterium haemolyticum]